MAFHTQRLASAGALSPPVADMTLAYIHLYGSTTGGALRVTYGDSQAEAVFPVLATGDGDANQTYRLQQVIKGTNYPASAITFSDGLDEAILVYTDEPSKDLPSDHPSQGWADFRGLYFSRTDAGTNTADLTAQDFAGGDNYVKAALVHCSGDANGRINFDPVGPSSYTLEAQTVENPVVRPVDQRAPQGSHGPEAETDAATTIVYVAYY